MQAPKGSRTVLILFCVRSGQQASRRSMELWRRIRIEWTELDRAGNNWRLEIQCTGGRTRNTGLHRRRRLRWRGKSAVCRVSSFQLEKHSKLDVSEISSEPWPSLSLEHFRLAYKLGVGFMLSLISKAQYYIPAIGRCMPKPKHKGLAFSFSYQSG